MQACSQHPRQARQPGLAVDLREKEAEGSSPKRQNLSSTLADRLPAPCLDLVPILVALWVTRVLQIGPVLVDGRLSVDQ